MPAEHSVIGFIRYHTTEFNNGFYVKVRSVRKEFMEHVICLYFTGDVEGLAKHLVQKLKEYGYKQSTAAYISHTTNNLTIGVYTPVGMLVRRLISIGVDINNSFTESDWDHLEIKTSSINETAYLELAILILNKKINVRVTNFNCWTHIRIRKPI